MPPRPLPPGIAEVLAACQPATVCSRGCNRTKGGCNRTYVTGIAEVLAAQEVRVRVS